MFPGVVSAGPTNAGANTATRASASYRIPKSSAKPSPVILPHQARTGGTAESVEQLLIPRRPYPWAQPPPKLLVPGAREEQQPKKLALLNQPGDPTKLVIAHGSGSAAVVRALAENGNFKELRQLWDGPNNGALAGNPALLNKGKGRRNVSPGMVARAKSLWGPVDREVRVTVPGQAEPVVARVEGGPKGDDPIVNEAFENMGAAAAMYRAVYGRSSIDGKGTKLVTILSDKSNVAMNQPDGTVRLGRGDGTKHRAWTETAIVGHEFTHTLIRETANFDRAGQPGALAEHFSDVFGMMLVQWHDRTPVNKASWVQGAKTVAVGAANDVKPVRSMSNPNSIDNQPAHMSQFIESEYGSYSNVGIPNRAFVGAATRMGGYAWETAGKVWYVTLRDHLRHDSSFQDTANATVHVAGELFGVGSREQRAVIAGWHDVGISVRPTNRAPTLRETGT